MKTIVFALAAIVLISVNVAHVITLHEDFMRWCSREGNEIGPIVYAAATGALVIAVGWLV